ncbi:MAG: hypothetical protein ACTS2F_21095 [Thainema sp.]
MSQPATLGSTPSDAGEVQCPPSHLWSDEPPLESDFHRDQIDLLIRILRWWWRERMVYVWAAGVEGAIASWPDCRRCQW